MQRRGPTSAFQEEKCGSWSSPQIRGRRPTSALQEEKCGSWSSPQIGGRRPTSALQEEKCGSWLCTFRVLLGQKGLLQHFNRRSAEVDNVVWTSSTRPIMSVLCTSYVVDAADHVNAMYFGLVPPHMSQGLLCTPSPPNDSIVKVGCPPTALQPFVDTPWMCPLRAPQEYLRGPMAVRCLTTWRLGGCDTDTSEPPWR